MSYEYGSILFDSLRDACTSMCYDFATAHGINSTAESLDEISDREFFVNELLAAWGEDGVITFRVVGSDERQAVDRDLLLACLENVAEQLRETLRYFLMDGQTGDLYGEGSTKEAAVTNAVETAEYYDDEPRYANCTREWLEEKLASGMLEWTTN